MKSIKCPHLGIVAATLVSGVLSGCIVDGPEGRVYVPAPTVQVEASVAVQDDYVYYPGYEVYYSSGRRQYLYRDGGSWVSRPTPPHVSAEVLFASPSVRVDFHDHPSAHHETIVRQYPKHWAPPGHSKHEGRDEGDEKGRRERGQ